MVACSRRVIFNKKAFGIFTWFGSYIFVNRYNRCVASTKYGGFVDEMAVFGWAGSVWGGCCMVIEIMNVVNSVSTVKFFVGGFFGDGCCDDVASARNGVWLTL